MASVFTFDPDPPRVSSPWLLPPASVPDPPSRFGPSSLADIGMPPTALLVDCGVTKLKAEPQLGPTEYKLHLLLRPRRSFSASTTGQHVSGSHQSKVQVPGSEVEPDPGPVKVSPAFTPSNQSRQNRLQHLTTQLLWRLQQSSPYHSSSKADLIVPVLPDAATVSSASGSGNPGHPLPGIEGSQGALYEIGVSDDGTLVGLTRDELDESLQTLRSMAASLGCVVNVLRVIVVGSCQWMEEDQRKDVPGSTLHEENLWVVEALVVPNIRSQKNTPQPAQELTTPIRFSNEPGSASANWKESVCHTEQLRVSLTGGTTSGKSSLLGTLSTSTLDNGRGKSRLSLLKHRHEISTGATSSVTPELVGYTKVGLDDGRVGSRINVVNYASGNVASWNDIHNAAEPGRLVFLTDSAGHPRYLRTTIRGLVSWAPHWTICCVAADDDEPMTGKTGATASAREILGPAGVGVDLSRTHLELCLELGLPLIVVITKFDLASKPGLRQTLTKILSTIKLTGRQPAIMSTSSGDDLDPQLQCVAQTEEDEVKEILVMLAKSKANSMVPIILTSAVTGSGVGKLHALLCHVPVPCLNQTSGCSPSSTQSDNSKPRSLFQIDEVFTMPHAQTSSLSGGQKASRGTIVSGYLLRGAISVGDELLIGPFASESTDTNNHLNESDRASSFPRQERASTRSPLALRVHQRPSSGDFSGLMTPGSSAYCGCHEWQKIHIVSVRNLRLPVRNLLADQVGTIGITFQESGFNADDSALLKTSRVRKGMVLMTALTDVESRSCLSSRGFVARFDRSRGFPIFPGSTVIVYIASIRASAKVIFVDRRAAQALGDELFHFDDSDSDGSGAELPQRPDEPIQAEMTIHFINSREWIEIGSQVLVMHGGGPSPIIPVERGDKGSVGLDGLVGRIIQTLA